MDTTMRNVYGAITAIPEHVRPHAALLPTPYSHWDSKGRGEQLSLDLYGYTASASVWQVRTAYRRAARHYLTVTRRYVLVDHGEVRDVPAQRVRAAARLYPTDPKATVIAARGFLKLPGPTKTRWTGYKVVLRRPSDGALVSVWDGETEYRLGKMIRQKALPDHGGGFYVSRTPELAVEHGEQVAPPNRWPRVLIECECYGRGIEYRGGKVAVSELRPVAILREWTPE